MRAAETEPPADNPRKCPTCGTELRDAVLSGQCPVCMVKVLADTRSPRREEGEAARIPTNPPRHVGGYEDREAARPSPGQLRYFADYELLAEIGRGGMGVVYRARQLSLNRTVALKLIAPEQLTSPKAIERFRAEAESAASLDHPNIVPIYETGEREGRHYFSMKLIEGQNLAEKSSEFRVPSSASGRRVANSELETRNSKLAVMLAKVAGAVHYAHQRGILHRDLKPGNILIDASGEPHVADFGLAKHFKLESSLTVSGEVLGTPAYMAPEQAAGKARQMTTAADVYSLGVILYELLTGQPPFRGETAVETLHAVLHHEPPKPRSVNPAVPRDLETICLKCLEKEPAKRYASAQELADELGRFVRSEPIQARAISPPEKVWRWCRRKPALAATLLLMNVILVLGLAGILWQWRRAENNAAESRRKELTARENLYAADINQIQRALAADNFKQARKLLQTQVPKAGEPDLRGFEWRYLWRQCQSDELFSLPGHENTVTSVAFSPDGRLLATGSYDGTLRIWDLAARRALATLKIQERRGVQSVSFSAQGDLLAACIDRKLKVWDARTFQPLRDLTNEMLTRFTRFSPDGKFLVAGTTNGFVLWDTQTWSVLKTFDLKRNLLDSYVEERKGIVAFSPDGRRIGVVVDDGVKLLSVPDLQEMAILKDQMPRIRFVAFSPDGHTLATCASGSDVKLWDIDTEKELQLISGHSDSVFAAAFSPDGKRLATCSADQTVKLWEVESGRLVRTFRGHVDKVWDVAFSPDGKLLASAGREGAVKLWDSAATSPQNSELPADCPFGFTADGNLMAFSGSMLAAFDTETFQKVGGVRPLAKESTESTPARADNIFGDGSTAVLARRIPKNRDTLDVFDLHRRRLLVSPVEHAGGALECAFAPKRQLLATPTSHHTVSLWQLPEGSRRFVLTNAGNLLAFSPDEAMLATGENSESEWVKIWEIKADHVGVLSAFGLEKLRVGVERLHVGALAFSPDGRLLAIGEHDGDVSLWDPRSGRQLASLTGHKRHVSSISFSPDGRTLASLGADRNVRLWHVTTRRELLRFEMPPNFDALASSYVGFSPDGRALLVQGPSPKDKTLGGILNRIFFAPSLDEIALAEGTELAPPKDPISWHVRGRALAKRDRLEEAVQAFDQVIKQTTGQHHLDALRASALEHRAQLRKGLGRLAEAGADNCTALDLPRRDPNTPARLIDLSPYFTSSLDHDSLDRFIPFLDDLPNLPQGRQRLPGAPGVEFDLRGRVQLNWEPDFPGIPHAVEGISVRQKCRRLQFLHATYRLKGEDKNQDVLIAAYVVHYADGKREEIPILSAEDMRGSRGATVAWEGTNSARLFNKSWENPHPEVEIQSLDFVSKMTKCCAPYLIAITAEP